MATGERAVSTGRGAAHELRLLFEGVTGIGEAARAGYGELIAWTVGELLTEGATVTKINTPTKIHPSLFINTLPLSGISVLPAPDDHLLHQRAAFQSTSGLVKSSYGPDGKRLFLEPSDSKNGWLGVSSLHAAQDAARKCDSGRKAETCKRLGGDGCMTPSEQNAAARAWAETDPAGAQQAICSGWFVAGAQTRIRGTT